MRKSDIVLIKDGFLGQRMVYVPSDTNKRVKEDPRIKDLYITHIGYFPKAIGQYRKRKLGCIQYILIYCKKGEGWVSLNHKKHYLKDNTIFIIPPNTKCAYGASLVNPWNNYWIHFTGTNAANYTPKLGTVISIAPELNARIDDRMILFEEMLSNMEQHSNYDNVVYANIGLKYFLTSIKQIENYRFSGETKKYDYLSLAISFMNNNLKNKITLAQLSQVCHCSISNLNKVFSKSMHCSPMQYYIQIKMQRACRYLLHSNRKIKDISQDLGYDDPYYFSRLFAKTIGKSPRVYRQEERDS